MNETYKTVSILEEPVLPIHSPCFWSHFFSVHREKVRPHISTTISFPPIFSRKMWLPLKNYLHHPHKFGLKLNFIKYTVLDKKDHVNDEGFRPSREYIDVIIEIKLPSPPKKKQKKKTNKHQNTIGRLVWIRHFLDTRLHEQFWTDMFAQQLVLTNDADKRFAWTETTNKNFEKSQEETILTINYFLS